MTIQNEKTQDYGDSISVKNGSRKKWFFSLFVLKLGIWNKPEFCVYLLGVLNPITFKIVCSLYYYLKYHYKQTLHLLNQVWC